VRLIVCALSVGLATGLVRTMAESSLIWVANGVLLSFLLLASRRRWPIYLVAGFLAQFAGGALSGLPARTNLLLTALNLFEVSLCLLLRKRAALPPRFTDQKYLIRFLGYCILVGPMATCAIVAIITAWWPQTDFGSPPIERFAAHALGIGFITPICVAILRGQFKNTPGISKQWIYLPILAVATPIAFLRFDGDLLFALYPLLVLVLLRMGMGWAAMSTLYVAGVGGWCTLYGHGPFAASSLLAPHEPSILLQLFIAGGVFMLYSISVVLEREQSTVKQLEQIAALHALVSENSRDAIILADLTGHRSYGSAAAASIDGWKPEELMTEDGIELVHPDDRERAQAIIRQLNSGTEGAMIECRVRKENGEYIWVEASLRVVRDVETGAPARFLNIVRDISERKQAEKKLQEAYEAVEALAITDPLTGLANRRRFDQYVGAEWRRSARDHQPLSLLMLDVDKFKVYNDTYVHQRGDSCLKQIAEACQDVVSRPGDLIARFGGEEFVVVLPNTDNDGAMKIGNDICESLRSRRLAHSGNNLGVVTISIGCATLIPKFGKHAVDLIEMADQALYKAKMNGRNQVCNGNKMLNGSRDTQVIDLPQPITSKTA
jgi:diguanylate cyclase (GGDEF)-like protein/PAS domain S-box-containing protein